MGKKLIITEKPSVARDFAAVLKVKGSQKGYMEDDRYVISWCYGHLVEMVYPEEYDIRYKKWRLADLPFLPETYKYGVIESSKDQYAIVHSLLHREDIDTVYWAGDSGKEGQTIEENIRNYGGVREGMEELRVWIDSQTDEEILRGLKEAKPMSAYARLGRSGIMRTIEDYSLGINFSRVLSVKYGQMINDAAATKKYTAIAIGRVMTCVLGMVVNREREIRDFVETPFYKVVGSFSDAKFNAEWKAAEKSAYVNSPLLYRENGFKKEEDAKALIEILTGKNGTIDSVENSKTRKKAPLLFNLAELQAECSKLFKISPDQALQAAQDLYEKKLTTYPRTDARVLTTAIAKEIRKNLSGLAKYEPMRAFCEEILAKNADKGLEKTAYTDDSKVTDHYAIIPTGFLGGIGSLTPIQKSVYELIAKRFLSIFYPNAVYQNMKLRILVDNEPFYTSAKVLIDPGYMKVAGIPKSKEENAEEGEENFGKEEMIRFAQSVKKGDEIVLHALGVKEGKTSPPKRYTSGNLILAMENAGNLIEDEELREQIKNSGIGTSATRGEILKKLVKIHYLHLNSKTQVITPEQLGEMIYEVVRLSIPNLLNPEMTANWEKGLEGIVNGTVDDKEYRRKLEDYIRSETDKMIKTDLRRELSERIRPFSAKESKKKTYTREYELKCPICGSKVEEKDGVFLCSAHKDDESGCAFKIGPVLNVSLTKAQVYKLIRFGKTDHIKGFQSAKTGDVFDAKVGWKKDESGKITGLKFLFEP